MKLQPQIYLILIFSFLTFSCEKEAQRLDDILLEFATVVAVNNKTAFRLDNNLTLIPNDTHKNNVVAGQRVILNYTPLRGDTIKVNQVSEVYLGTIDENQTAEHSRQDPVKIQSIWVSGGYLNMIFDVEYHSKGHKIGLERNKSSSLSDLYFTYSRENDPPGYYKKTYVSFELSALYNDTPPTNNFTLKINTISGIRHFQFELSGVPPADQ